MSQKYLKNASKIYKNGQIGIKSALVYGNQWYLTEIICIMGKFWYLEFFSGILYPKYAKNSLQNL